MAHKIHHFPEISIVSGDIRMNINLDRFSEQFNRAQFALDSAVMTSMVPFMPMQDGDFVNRTKAESAALAGTGEVMAAAPPQGRFLYEGKGMVDEKTGSPWAKKGAKKVLVSQFAGRTNAKENLSYSKNAHPKAQSHWFDAAKQEDLDKWVKEVKEIAGGG